LTNPGLERFSSDSARSSDMPAVWSMVPMAPSQTRIRCPNASLNALTWMIDSESSTDLRRPCAPSGGRASAALAHPLLMGSLRSSAPDPHLGHLATESLAANSQSIV